MENTQSDISDRLQDYPSKSLFNSLYKKGEFGMTSRVRVIFHAPLQYVHHILLSICVAFKIT